jgi:hypothetical protein
LNDAAADHPPALNDAALDCSNRPSALNDVAADRPPVLNDAAPNRPSVLNDASPDDANRPPTVDDAVSFDAKFLSNISSTAAYRHQTSESFVSAKGSSSQVLLFLMFVFGLCLGLFFLGPTITGTIVILIFCCCY